MKTQYILIAIFFVSVLVYFYNNEERIAGVENEFKATEINGEIIELTSQSRGYCIIAIRQYVKADTVKCSLLLGGFVADYNINIGDSISKLSNSERLIFFKKENNSYKKCCEADAF
jgi:hypothetical protein